PLLMLEAKTSTRKFFDDLLKKYNIELNPEVELGSVDLLIEMTRIGLGIAHVPQYSLNLSQKELFKIKLKEKLPQRKLAVVRNKEYPLSKAAERFLNVLA
ncbi:MAG: LysR family transcriptional regulator, partial [Halanaerobium sp. MSAO_Bac5]